MAPSYLTDDRLSVGALVFAGVLISFRWHLLRPFITLIHEIGHALAAALLGGQPLSITMSPDGSGLAVTSHPSPSRFVRSCVSYAGELAPGLAALGGAAALSADNAYAWLFLNSLVLLVVFIGLARSTSITVVILFVLGGIGFYLFVWPWTAPAIAGFLIGIWSFGGCRSAYEQMTGMRRMRLLGSKPRLYDAERVQQMTGVPAPVIAKSQFIVSIALAICATGFVVLG